jgi:hypothetical protein
MSAATTTISPSRSAGPGKDFRHRAACRGVDPEVFFPAAEDGPRHEVQVAAAKAVCARCPVRAECLAWALAALPYGVAGGMSEQERSQARARRRRNCQSGRRVFGRPAGGSPAEVAAAGRAAIRAGRTPREVAREFEVSERTAMRWAAQTRVSGRTGSSVEGSHGGNRAPLLVSHAHNPQPGTRAAEGHRG